MIVSPVDIVSFDAQESEWCRQAAVWGSTVRIWVDVFWYERAPASASEPTPTGMMTWLGEADSGS
jgi:hypothetical protein